MSNERGAASVQGRGCAMPVFGRERGREGGGCIDEMYLDIWVV